VRFPHIFFFSFLLVVASQAIEVLTGVSPLLSGRLVDGDCYMRLARVEALLGGQGWFDSSIMLLNAPFGEALHWTRPLDLLIALLALPLMLFLDLNTAVWLAGLWVSPLLEVLAVVGLIWGLLPRLSPSSILLVVFLFVFQPSVMGVFLAARPDHHGLQLCLEIWGLAGLTRGGGRAAMVAGLAAALALWVSAEALLLVLALLLALGLLWLIDGEAQRKRLLVFLAALAVGATLAQIIERPPLQWLDVEYDRLSLAQVGLCWFLLLAAAWTLIGNDWAKSWRGRSVLSLGMAAQVTALLSLCFPQFFQGPYGNLDPRLLPIWFSLVDEAQPIFFGVKSVAQLTPPLLGLAYALWRIRERTERPLLMPWLCALLVYLPATFVQQRATAFAVAADALPWALLILSALHLRLLRVGLVPLLLVGHWLLAGTVSKLGLGKPDPGPPRICSWNELATHLRANWPDDRRPILTYVFPGPELAYLSGHPVLAGPYHRSVQGILDIANGLGSRDDAYAQELVKRRQLGWIAVCDRETEGLTFDEKNGSDGFHAKLTRGNSPYWLKPMGGLAATKGNFMLYEVRD
jgi:hypothetical protein